MIAEILNAGLWHDSTGDLAIAQSVVQQLGKRGIATIPTTRASGDHPCVVGGGALLTGERDGMWWRTLEPFHAPGRHILNAVTAVSDGDFGYLKDYIYVTTRDEPSRKILLKYRPDAVCVPCTTALMERPDFDYQANLPNHDWLRRLKKKEFILVDVEAVRTAKIREEVITVATRPWIQKGKADIVSRHPNDLLAAILVAKAVVAGSLHLSILAVAMGKPTVFVRNGSAWKGDGYWGRAGFKEIMYSGDDPVGYALCIHDRIGEVNEQERERAAAHMDRIAEVLVACS